MMLAFDSHDRAEARNRMPPGPASARAENAHEVSNPLWDNLATRGPVVPRDPQGSATVPPEPRSSFKSCDPKRMALVLEAAQTARKLAETALEALDRPLLLSFQRTALRRNFGAAGDSHRDLITDRYRRITESLGAKNFICKTKCPEKKGHLCAQAPSTGNTIYICPPFGSPGCPPAITILHEAAHNAGATGDIDKDSLYPPANAEDNSYSYEYFVEDLKKNLPMIELTPKRGEKIEILK